MSKREAVTKALAHEPGGPLPWQLDMTNAFADIVTARYGCDDADEFVGNHLLRAKYKDNRQTSDSQEVDIFGVTWAKSPDGGDVGTITDHPLKGSTFDGYTFPEIRSTFASSLCDQLEARTDVFSMFSITMGFFERAWSLRGMEPLLIDMAAEPQFAESLFAAIEEHHLALLDCVLARDFDCVYFGDDWGQQQGLIMGPPMWRRYIKPGLGRIFDRIKSSGKTICLHSCGDLRDVFPDIIDMGVDIYNTLQPEIYDLARMKREYGKDITFYGGISTQQFLPYATPAEVKDETRRVCDILGHNGGYIMSATHALTPDIPVENMMAMIEVAKE
jgi:uroporphyrinogen decarboxylase